MTKDGSKTIWQYWEGDTIPAYYALCQETVARHNTNVRVIGPDDLPELIGPVPEILQKAYITHRIDWIRKQLLFKQGGVYVDSDFICFKSLEMFQELSQHLDYGGYVEWTGGWMDNFMCAKKGSRILEISRDYAQAILELKNGKIEWLEATRDALKHAFDQVQWSVDWIKFPTHLIEPQKVIDAWWFLEKTDKCPDHNCFGFMTSVHNLRSWCMNKSREELLSGEERVCHLFRKAMA